MVPKKNMSKSRFFAILCIILMAAIVVSGCANTPSSSKEKRYVVTKAASYDADGLQMRWTEYKYDGDAQLLQADNWTLQPVMEYDPAIDCMVAIYNENCEHKLAESITYEYDKDGNRISWRDECEGGFVPGNYTYAYTYGDDGRIASYTATIPGTADTVFSTEYHLEYDKKGNLCTVSYHNGTEEVILYEYEYDSSNRLTQEISHSKVEAKRIDFTYDGDQLTGLQYYTGTPGQASKEHTTYAKRASIAYTYDGSQLTRQTTYDADGNVSEVFNYEYNKKDLLTQVSADGGELQYTYDDNGNVTKIACSDGSYITYEYEAVSVTAEQYARYKRLNTIFDEMLKNDYSLFPSYFRHDCFYNWMSTAHYSMIPNPLL